MTDEVIEIKKIALDIVVAAEQLKGLETFEGTDYSGVITDLKWNRMVLLNRLAVLRSNKQ